MKKLTAAALIFNRTLPGFWLSMCLISALSLPVSLPLVAVFFLLQNVLIHAAPQTMRYPLIITLIVLCALVTAESPVSFSMLGMLLLFGVMTLAMLWLNQEPAIPLAAIVLSAFLLAVLVQIRQQATLTGAALLFLFSLVVLRVQHHLRCSMPAPSLPSDDAFRLLCGLALLQLALLLIIGPLQTLFAALTEILRQGIVWLLSHLVELLAFLFSGFILLIQHAVEWLLAHRQADPSTSITVPSEPADDLFSQTSSSTSALADGLFALIVAGLLTAAGLLLFSLIRRWLKRRQPSSLDSGFHSEASSSRPSSATLRRASVTQAPLSAIRRRYRRQVDIRGHRGTPIHPYETPNEYLRRLPQDQSDSQFDQLTEQYNRERYRPQ